MSQGQRQTWDWVWPLLAPRTGGRCQSVAKIADTILVKHGLVEPTWLFTNLDAKVRNRFNERDHRSVSRVKALPRKLPVKPASAKQLIRDVREVVGPDGCIVRVRGKTGGVVLDTICHREFEWSEEELGTFVSGFQECVAIQLLPLAKQPTPTEFLPMTSKSNDQKEDERSPVARYLLPTFTCSYHQHPEKCNVTGDNLEGVGSVVTEISRKPGTADAAARLGGGTRSTGGVVNRTLDMTTRRIVGHIQARGGCNVLSAKAEFLWQGGDPVFVGFDEITTTEPRTGKVSLGASYFDSVKKVLVEDSVRLEVSSGELKASNSAPQIGLLPKRPAKQLKKRMSGANFLNLPTKYRAELTLPPWRMNRTLTDRASRPASAPTERHCYGDYCMARVANAGHLRDLESSHTPWMEMARDLCQPRSFLDGTSRHSLFTPAEMAQTIEQEELSGKTENECAADKHHGMARGLWLLEARSYPLLCKWLEESNGWMLDPHDPDQVIAAEEQMRCDEANLRKDGRGDILKAMQSSELAAGPGLQYFHRSFPLCPACLRVHTAIHLVVNLIRDRKKHVWARKERQLRKEREERERQMDLAFWVDRAKRRATTHQLDESTLHMRKFEPRSYAHIMSQSVTPNPELSAFLNGVDETWVIKGKSFCTRAENGDLYMWEWMPKDTCVEMQIIPGDDPEDSVDKRRSIVLEQLLHKTTEVRQPWTLPEIRRLVETKHAIDTTDWATPPHKNFKDLLKELQTGHCALVQGDEGIMRLVEDVVVRIRCGSYIVIAPESHDAEADGNIRLPHAAIRPHEDVIDGAYRILREELGLPSQLLSVQYSQAERLIDISESLDYPGLMSAHQQHFVDASLAAEDGATLSLVGMPGLQGFRTLGPVVPGQEREVQQWIWMQEQKTWLHGVRTRGLKGSRAKELIPDSWKRVHCQWNPKSVAELLSVKGIDMEMWGGAEARRLEQLASELSMGKSYLLESDRMLFRCVDVVLMMMHSAEGNLLIETSRAEADKTGRGNHVPVTKNHLPGMKRDPDKSLQDCLNELLLLIGVEPSTMQIQLGEELFVKGESRTYPGVDTIYRKHFVHVLPKRKSTAQPRTITSEIL